MVAAMASQAMAQSFVRPLRLSPSSSSPHSPSKLRHLPIISSSLPFKNHYHSLSLANGNGNDNGCGSLLYLTSNTGTRRPLSLHLHQRLKPVAALEADLPHSHQSEESATYYNKDEAFKRWDWWTATFAATANIPFLLLQLPQIVLNARNLMSGNKSALFAINWMGMLTGLLGNLSLLSYFAKKRETEAMVVQVLGVITTYIVIAQLAMADAMPFSYFVATSVAVATGLFLNFLHYFGMLPSVIWNLWDDVITVGGFSVLTQVMWSTFVPHVPNSVLPGAIAFVAALLAVAMGRAGKMSEKGGRFLGLLSGWTATLLFMWMPVAQMWTNYMNPGNIKGLSAISVLLSMIGNGLMIPRALFIRDPMWFTGSSWASMLYGWGNLLCLYLFNNFNKEFFFSSSAGLLLWLGFTFWKDCRAHGHSNPFRSLKELVVG